MAARGISAPAHSRSRARAATRSSAVPLHLALADGASHQQYGNGKDSSVTGGMQPAARASATLAPLALRETPVWETPAVIVGPFGTSQGFTALPAAVPPALPAAGSLPQRLLSATSSLRGSLRQSGSIRLSVRGPVPWGVDRAGSLEAKHRPGMPGALEAPGSGGETGGLAGGAVGRSTSARRCSMTLPSPRSFGRGSFERARAEPVQPGPVQFSSGAMWRGAVAGAVPAQLDAGPGAGSEAGAGGGTMLRSGSNRRASWRAAGDGGTAAAAAKAATLNGPISIVATARGGSDTLACESDPPAVAGPEVAAEGDAYQLQGGNWGARVRVRARRRPGSPARAPQVQFGEPTIFA